MKRFIAFSLFAAFVSSSVATDTWVQVEYTSSHSVKGGPLTLNPWEVTMSAPNTYNFSLNRIIMKKTVTGAATEDPDWIVDLTPIGYSNQTVYCSESNVPAPNGYSVSIIYDQYDNFQKFQLYEDGEPVRDFVTRSGQTNENPDIYITVF